MRRGEKNVNHRQCATRVKIISVKIREGKREEIDLDNSRSFYSQSFVDVILVGERGREIKIVSKSVLCYYLYSCKTERRESEDNKREFVVCTS